MRSDKLPTVCSAWIKPRIETIRSLFFPILAIIIGTTTLSLLVLHKEVTLVIDGQSQQISTFALTVGGMLQSTKVSLGPQDKLEPPAGKWLQDGDTVTLNRALPVQVLADGRVYHLLTAERLPKNLLTQAGILLGEEDRLLWQGSPIEPEFLLPRQAGVLQVVRALSFTLQENGQKTIYRSSAPSLGQALWENGVVLSAADRLNPSPLTPLTLGLEATLERARPVIIQTQSASFSLHTAAATVGEALAELGFAPQGLDYSLPPAGDPLPVDGLIRLVRVREEVLIEQTPLEFETQYQPVSDLELDNQIILQTGEYGLVARRVRVRYEDGLETSRQLEDEWVAREPQARIIGYGTQIVMHTAIVDGTAIEYWRAITMWATSYHPSETSPTTASGLPLAKGVCAVDVRYIPFYTRMYVPGYGEVIAADVGGGIVGRMIDLGYSDEDYVPWHQFVTVYFLWPPPEKIVYIFP